MKNLSNIVYKLSFVFLAMLFLSLAGCKEDEDANNVVLDAPVDIAAFEVNGTSGVIDESKDEITIALPFGTDITNVTPTITAPEGASVTPAPGTAVNLSSPVIFRVNNGNIFTRYTVKATVQPAILAFKINDVAGVINEVNRTISVTLPPGTDATNLSPVITLSEGITISPASGAAQNFTEPVQYTVTSSATTATYTVTVVVQGAIPDVAYLGTYANRNEITNRDEKAAADWLFANYNHAEYVSFDEVNAGAVDLSKYKVIWWHYDVGTALPDIAFEPAVVDKLKAYRAGGGNFFFTTYAALYLPTLEIIPAGKGSNNAFGDTTPLIDPNNSWGISFAGNEDHPLFQGLELIPDKPYAAAYLLAKGTYRLNHTAWWKVNEWGGYGDAAGWRSQTGGIDLASSDGEETRNSTVGIAEFPASETNGATIVIAMGAYDWFNEPAPEGQPAGVENQYKSNIETLTRNAINYLSEE